LQEEKPLYFILMSVVMLSLSVALPLLDFGFWAYMGTISAVIIAMAVAMYFFDSKTQTQNDTKATEPKKVKKETPKPVQEKVEPSETNAPHIQTGYFGHNY